MEGYQNFSQDDFDPDVIANQTAEVTQFIVMLDHSSSMADKVTSMNTVTTSILMQELKNCHKAPQIFIKAIDFASSITHRSGFLPIVDLPDDYFEVKNPRGTTALYEAVDEAFQHVSKFRTDLENQGVEVKTCIFVVTDGEQWPSNISAMNAVKDHVAALRKNEAWASTFTINVLGIGDDTNMFRTACIDMGLNPDLVLSVATADVKDIRQKMGVVSQSVSSSSNSGTKVSF